MRVPNEERRGDLPQRLPDDAVRHVINRAIEIDGELKTQTSFENLRAIASDLGISQEALELALRELARGDTTLSVQTEQSRTPREQLPRGDVSWFKRALRAAIPLGLMSGTVVAGLGAALMIGRTPGFLLLTLLAVGVGAAAGVRPRGVRFRDAFFVAMSFWGCFVAGTFPVLLTSTGDVGEVLAIAATFFTGSVALAGALDLYLRLFNPGDEGERNNHYQSADECRIEELS